jgi:phosphatidylglycerol:prolipoprotein diacylglycerol transferase
MFPILLKIPAYPLFIACFVVAAIAIIRDVVPWRGKKPGFPMTAVWAVAGAALLAKFVGKWGNDGPGVIANLHAGYVPIYAYGVMLGSSLVVGWFIAMHLAKQDGIDQQEAGTIYMWTAVWSIIGSRLLWYFTTPAATIGDIPLVNQGGLVAYGGMIGGFLASVFCCRRRGIPLLQWADVAAPSVVLGTAITRIGCFLFGCDYGRPSGLPWAVRFPGPNSSAPNGSPAWQHHLQRCTEELLQRGEPCGLERTATESFPVHPTQIYESLVGLSLFGLLMLIRKYRKFSGQVFLGWVLGYGILRPLIEQVRGDEDRGVKELGSFNLSTSTVIGLTSVVLGIVLLIVLVRKYRRDPEGSRLWLRPVTAGGPEGGPAKAERGGGKRRKRR